MYLLFEGFYYFLTIRVGCLIMRNVLFYKKGLQIRIFFFFADPFSDT